MERGSAGNMGTMQEAIKKRRSVRTYLEKKVEAEKMERVKEILSVNTSGPFGNEVRYVLLDLEELEEKEIKRLGTYGIIKGTRLFLAGAIKDGRWAMEDFGYCMEKVILELTSLGLGTCWIAGTFRRNNFAEKVGLAEGEVLPAITPFGYARDNRSLIERLLRFLAGSRNRKAWKEMFFDGDLQTALTPKTAGDYSPALEAVRLGPSASNKQPWIIIRGKGLNVFHFFLKSSGGYVTKLGNIKIQHIDMGIAICHFDLVAREVGKKGTWVLDEHAPYSESGDMEYIATWKES